MGGRLTWLLRGSAVALVIILAIVAIEFVVTRDATPPITGADGVVVAGSIASLETVELGGVSQTVLIRGHDRTNPVLLFLHGGPGMPAMYLAHAFQRDLEEDFVVVHWDRRGAGKSYRTRGPEDQMTVRRLLEDAYELTRILRRRFQQQRIHLVGHSWGSYLGTLAISERPEYFAAYVGTGQIAGSPAETNSIRRAEIARRATLVGDSSVASALRSGEQAVTEDLLFRYGGELRGETSYWPLLRTGLFAPEYTLFEALDVPKGSTWAARHLRNDQGDEPLDSVVTRVDVPVFFFLGRHDLNTPAALAVRYLERLEAPCKGIVWFEESAHFPFFEEPARFHEAMVDVQRSVESC